jgi:hypothetical protein
MKAPGGRAARSSNGCLDLNVNFGFILFVCNREFALGHLTALGRLVPGLEQPIFECQDDIALIISTRGSHL